MEVKCIFQGGGAKLATLLAVSEVLEELEENNELQITEVAGTSAGSIAAFAFASKTPTKQIKQQMSKAGIDVIKHFAKKPTTSRIIYSAALNNTLYNEEKLRTFIRNSFSTESKSRISLSDARIPVYVRTANIRTGAKHTHKPDHEISLEQALADSCAIPFAIRSFSAASSYVDGGILSNLADPSVFKDHQGNIIAFTFERSPEVEFRNLKTFLGSVANTMIDGNVEESIDKIMSCGGQVCWLPNHFNTFEFSKALTEGLSEKYIATHKETLKYMIREAVDGLKRRHRVLEKNDRLPSLNRFASTIVRATTAREPYSVVSNTITCIARNLESPNLPDVLSKDVEIKAVNDQISAFRIGITRNEVYELGRDIHWNITDVNGQTLVAAQEVIESSQDDEIVWHSCFFLSEPVEKSRTPLKVRLVTTHMGLMSLLASPDGNEWMRAASDQTDSIQQQNFLLGYPKSLGTLVMVDLVDGIHRVQNPPSSLEKMQANWCEGKKLTEADIAEYSNSFMPYSDLNVVGWRATDLPPGAFAGTLIERIRNKL